MSHVRFWMATVRHLTPGQIAARATKIVRARCRAIGRARVKLPRTVTRLRARLPAGQSHGTPPALEPEWHHPPGSRLASFDLHGFAYAGSLDAPSFLALAHSWIRANARLLGDGWQPYTISVRVPSWLIAMERLGIEDELLLRSAYAQLRFLAGNLEHDVGGNHLIKNLRALVIGAAAFGGEEPQRWLAQALPELRMQVAKQVLEDGGHYERTPAYHAAVLDDLRDIAGLLEEVPDWLSGAIGRMERYLERIARPDGKLPLLKDSTWDAGRSVVPSEESSAVLPDSGFAVIREGGAYTIFDFGAPCPAELPAHAHADALSFEHIAGDYAVVDSGVYEYEAGVWRDYFRSTRAHNTVEVGGVDQSDMWSSFRVGRRARVRLLRFEADAAAVLVQAEHDGYARRRPRVLHRRTLVRLRGSDVLIVVDDLTGSGYTTAASYVHLAPGVEPPHIASYGFDEVSRERGWYSERFGSKSENLVIVLRRQGQLPMRFGYVVSRSAATIAHHDGVVTVEGENGISVSLRVG